MKNTLLLSLGHNSSAIFVDSETKKVIAYEQERIDKIKSSSAFPKGAIEEIIKNVGINKLHGANVCITHWYDNLTYTSVESDLKYNDNEYLKMLQGFGCTIVTHTPQFTHHDAHAWSVASFFKYHFLSGTCAGYNGKIHIIVADGFGNKEEVVSVYELDFDEVTLEMSVKNVKKVYGYKNSLGLMYQYATSFVGMKENQDEYKFLGYESHIKEFFSEKDITTIDLYVNDLVLRYNKLSYDTHTEPSLNNEFINVDSLNKVKAMFHREFELLTNSFGITDKTDFKTRVLVGYFIQQIVEKIITGIVYKLDIKNLIVAGGLFYNVKLNNKILKHTDGLFCAMPLAGDQGASIGFYEKNFSNFPWSDKLLWGKRDVSLKTFEDTLGNLPNTYHFTDKEECAYFIAEKIINGEIVNLIQNKMEFGPRALCNTSSLFMPQQKLAETNNALNNRNEVMPLAPVMLKDNVEFFFGLDLPIRVIGSDEYMIVTYDYCQNSFYELYQGVMHKYPTEEKYSGRPQAITEDSLIKTLLEKMDIWNVKCLVNTSYNYHGFPIAYTLSDVTETHKRQLENKEATDNMLVKKVSINVVVYEEQ